jgi:hypothetical protein
MNAASAAHCEHLAGYEFVLIRLEGFPGDELFCGHDDLLLRQAHAVFLEFESTR